MQDVLKVIAGAAVLTAWMPATHTTAFAQEKTKEQLAMEQRLKSDCLSETIPMAKKLEACEALKAIHDMQISDSVTKMLGAQPRR